MNERLPLDTMGPPIITREAKSFSLKLKKEEKKRLKGETQGRFKS